MSFCTKKHPTDWVRNNHWGRVSCRGVGSTGGRGGSATKLELIFQQGGFVGTAGGRGGKAGGDLWVSRGGWGSATGGGVGQHGGVIKDHNNIGSNCYMAGGMQIAITHVGLSLLSEHRSLHREIWTGKAYLFSKVCPTDCRNYQVSIWDQTSHR